LLEETCNS